MAGGTYAYALLPNSSLEATRTRAAGPGVSVLRNDSIAQAIRYTNVTAINFWKTGTVGDFTSTSSMCLIARKVPGMTRLSVSDPTQTGEYLHIELANAAVSRVKGPDAERVSLSRRGDNAVLAIDARDSAGATLEFSLHR